MRVYLRAKFGISSIFLKSFRQGVILPPIPPPTQSKPLTSPPKLELIKKKPGRLLEFRAFFYVDFYCREDISFYLHLPFENVPK